LNKHKKLKADYVEAIKSEVHNKKVEEDIHPDVRGVVYKDPKELMKELTS